jgi:hypothetical protein
MNSEVVEREVRRLRLMTARLDEFREGTLVIDRLIVDLEGLLWQLELTDDAWRDAFLEEWGEIEISYATALDWRKPWPTIADGGVRRAVDQLSARLERRIADFEPRVDEKRPWHTRPGCIFGLLLGIVGGGLLIAFWIFAANFGP